MTETISIVKTRDNELEFDINIRGAQKQNPVVRLVIEDRKIHYSFECNNTDGDKWIVAIPPLPQLTRKAYPFRLEVIIDGYFFEPYRKTMSVIPEPVVKSGKVAEKHPEKPLVNKKKAAPAKKKVVKKRVEAKPAKKVVAKEEVYIPPEAPVVVETPDDDFADMATAWMNRKKPVISEQDKKVKGLIKDAMKAKPAVVETAPVVVPVVPEELSKAVANDIKIKAILDSTKVK